MAVLTEDQSDADLIATELLGSITRHRINIGADNGSAFSNMLGDGLAAGLFFARQLERIADALEDANKLTRTLNSLPPKL
jgi:hypothetical protein